MNIPNKFRFLLPIFSVLFALVIVSLVFFILEKPIFVRLLPQPTGQLSTKASPTPTVLPSPRPPLPPPQYSGYIIEFSGKPSREEGAIIENRIKEALGERGANLKIQNRYYVVFFGVAAMISDQEAEIIKKISGVKSVSKNYEVEADLTDAGPMVGADQVWRLKADGTECQTNSQDCLTGRGIKVAVIDTGVDYTHPDLGGCFGASCKVAGGYDFVNRDGNPMDDQGHGTQVAGIIAGTGALSGIAPDAKIYAYKVLPRNGGGLMSNIMSGIEKAVGDGVDIMNLSLGVRGGNPDDPLSVAVDNATAMGVAAIISAGNDGLYGRQTIASPGTSRKAITVGAVDKRRQIAGFSSRGPVVWGLNFLQKPDVVAPGVDICSARSSIFSIREDNRCLDQKHIYMSGTSMAAPVVAGGVALLKQAHPAWSPTKIKSILNITATDLGFSPGEQGHGLINLPSALACPNCEYQMCLQENADKCLVNYNSLADCAQKYPNDKGNFENCVENYASLCRYGSDQYAGYPECLKNPYSLAGNFSSSYIFQNPDKQLCLNPYARVNNSYCQDWHPETAKCPPASRCPECPCGIIKSAAATAETVYTAVEPKCTEYDYSGDPLTFYCQEWPMWYKNASKTEGSEPLGTKMQCPREDEIPMGQVVDAIIAKSDDLSRQVDAFNQKLDNLIGYANFKVGQEAGYCRCDSKCTDDPTQAQDYLNLCKSGCEYKVKWTSPVIPFCYCEPTKCTSQSSPCQKMINLLEGGQTQDCPANNIGIPSLVNDIENSYSEAFNSFYANNSDILKILEYSRKKMTECDVKNYNFGDTREFLSRIYPLSCERAEDNLIPPITEGQTGVIYNGRQYSGRCYGRNLSRDLQARGIIKDDWLNNWFCCEKVGNQ